MSGARKLYLTPTLRRRLDANKAAYQEAERLTGVPWALLAAIHYRENDLLPTSPNRGGPMQKDPPWTPAQTAAYAHELKTTIAHPPHALRDSCVMAAWFIQKEKAKPRLTPSSPRAALLEAAFRYNGTAYGSAAKSPYVMSDPLNGHVMTIRGTIDGGAYVSNPDKKAGVSVILDELAGAAPQVSTGGHPIPTVAVASNTVYYPMADWARVRTDAGPFLSPAYRQNRGAWHTGVDLNCGAAGDGDLNEPVYAIADGVVLFAGWLPVWGNVVLIQHPQLGAWSQYAHLNSMSVRQGQSVTGAAQIGRIGKGDLSYGMAAHLHFEIRVRERSAGYWPGGAASAKAEIEKSHVEPLGWLRSHGARNIPKGGVQTDDLHPDLVRIRGAMIAWLRTRHPDLRLVTQRTYVPSLTPTLGPASSPPARLGPHNVRPALAFDFELRRGINGAALGSLDALYAALGKYAQEQGGLWGPNASPAPANEGGNLRNHVQLKNAEAALKEAQERAAAGAIPPGTANGDLAAEGSDPAQADENRRQNCPAPTAP